MRLFFIFCFLTLYGCGSERPRIPIPIPKPEPRPAPQDPAPEPPPPTPTPKPEPPAETPPPPPEERSFVEKNGFLKVSGNRIVNEHGEDIQLKGMSLFWSQWSSSFYNKKSVETTKTWGATVIRAAMGIEMGGYLQDPKGQKALVKEVVDAAIDQGIYVIIDWHDHNAHAHEKQATEFFSEMAETYKDTPHVIFELYNEPIWTPWSQIKNYAENVIAAIRAKGAKHLVIVGTPTWSQDVDQAALDPLDDPNVAYTLHFYASTHKESLRNKARFALSKGVALFVTEFGTTEASGDGYVDLTESEVWMDFMDEYKISWANWSLFDKAESASALKPGSGPNGGWSDSQLTNSGRYIKEKMKN